MSTISRGLAWLYDVTGMPQQGVYTAALCEGCCFFFSCFLKRLSLRLLVNGQGGTPQLVECIRKNMHVLCFKCLNERVTELLPIFDTNTPSRQDATKKKNTLFFWSLSSVTLLSLVDHALPICMVAFFVFFTRDERCFELKLPTPTAFFFLLSSSYHTHACRMDLLCCTKLLFIEHTQEVAHTRRFFFSSFFFLNAVVVC